MGMQALGWYLNRGFESKLMILYACMQGHIKVKSD